MSQATPTPAEVLDEARGECERLCRSLAPADFFGHRLYVVFTSELPADFRGGRLRGCTARDFDLVARPFVGDRWRGRGPAMMIDDVGLWRDAGDQAGALAADGGLPPTFTQVRYHVAAFRRLCRAVAVHEAAHVVQADAARGDPPPPEQISALASDLRGQAVGERPSPRAHVPFARHEWRYIRAAAHLVGRACLAGHGLDADQVLRPEKYRVSGLGDYVAALGDEVERLAWCSFADVGEAPPPPAFVELWQADFRRWFLAAELTPDRRAALDGRIGAMFIPSQERTVAA